MLEKLWEKNSLLIQYTFLSFIALLFIFFTELTPVSAAQIAPVSSISLKGNSSDFTWNAKKGIEVAKTKEELIHQYIEKISTVPENQSTFTIRLACNKDVYDWAVNKVLTYNTLPTKNNPVVQNSYHVYKINPKPYYAGDTVRKFDVLLSTSKDMNDKSLGCESIKTTKEMAMVASKVAKNIEKLDDRAKLNYIDDWLSYHFNYDNSLKKFTAAEGYKTGEFVCAGYTEMFKLISDYAGLGSKVELIYGQVNVPGSKGSHSWIIYSADNGKRYLIDPTHNDYQRTKKSCKKWFMLEENTVKGYTKTSVLKPLQNIFEK